MSLVFQRSRFSRKNYRTVEERLNYFHKDFESPYENGFRPFVEAGVQFSVSGSRLEQLPSSHRGTRL